MTCERVHGITLISYFKSSSILSVTERHKPPTRAGNGGHWEESREWPGAKDLFRFL